MDNNSPVKKNYFVLEASLMALLVLNLIDLICTMMFVAIDAMKEGNPLMDSLLQIHPIVFAVTKVALVSFGVIVLWHCRKKPIALVGSTIGLVVYTAVIYYHIQVADNLGKMLAEIR